MESEIRWKKKDEYKGMSPKSHKEEELIEMGYHLYIRDLEKEIMQEHLRIDRNSIIHHSLGNRVSKEQR